MKPRLEPCDHTDEDAFAWAHVVLEAPAPRMFGNVLWTRSLMQDRRDSDLIFELACMKSDMPDAKAVAHRMVEGQFSSDSILINGYWIALG